MTIRQSGFIQGGYVMPIVKWSKLVASCAVAGVLLAGCGSGVMESLHNASDVQGLAEALTHDGDAHVRADAATALGELGDPRAVGPLLVVITDAEVSVRVAAAGSVGKLGDKTAVVPLLAAEQDQAPEVRDSATQSLTTLLNGLAVPVAVTALTGALSDERPPVRAEADTALQRYAAGDAGRAAAAVVPLLQAQVDTAKPAEARDSATQALTTLLTGLSPADAVTALTAAIVTNVADVPTAAAGTSVLQQYVATVTKTNGKAATAVVPLLQTQVDPGQAAARDSATQALTALLNGLPDGSAVSALTAALNNAAVQDPADAALRQYLAGIGPDRAAAAVVAAKAGDPWLAVALAVPEDQLATETRRRGIELEPADAILNAAAAARDGTPVASTHPYQASDGFHPASVLLPKNVAPGSGAPFGQASMRWAPTALRFLELVVVLGDVNQTGEQLEVCNYVPIVASDGPGSITRYRTLQDVKVVSAVDGQIIAEQTFKGADPPACQDKESFPPDQPNLNRIGAAPDLTQAVPWLESLIHPPAPAGT